MNRLDLELPVQQFQILRLCAMFVFNLIRSRRYVEAAPGRGQGASARPLMFKAWLSWSVIQCTSARE